MTPPTLRFRPDRSTRAVGSALHELAKTAVEGAFLAFPLVCLRLMGRIPRATTPWDGALAVLAVVGSVVGVAWYGALAATLPSRNYGTIPFGFFAVSVVWRQARPDDRDAMRDVRAPAFGFAVYIPWIGDVFLEFGGYALRCRGREHAEAVARRCKEVKAAWDAHYVCCQLDPANIDTTRTSYICEVGVGEDLGTGPFLFAGTTEEAAIQAALDAAPGKERP